MPWVYTRQVVAREWHCRPWEVEDAPWDEILTTLKILTLEAEAEAWRQQRRAPGG